MIEKRIRCAIYTRKSTDEGLDMEFNSLDAQREAGEAFIATGGTRGDHRQKDLGQGTGASSVQSYPQRQKRHPFFAAPGIDPVRLLRWSDDGNIHTEKGKTLPLFCL